MSVVVELPPGVMAQRQRRKIARYLRSIADVIEADEAWVEPHAFVLTLTGRTHHETLAAGYQHDQDGFDDAVGACYRIGRAEWPTAGKAVRERAFRNTGRPYTRENIVQFAPPKKRSAPSTSLDPRGEAGSQPDVRGEDAG